MIHHSMRKIGGKVYRAVKALTSHNCAEKDRREQISRSGIVFGRALEAIEAGDTLERAERKAVQEILIPNAQGNQLFYIFASDFILFLSDFYLFLSNRYHHYL